MNLMRHAWIVIFFAFATCMGSKASENARSVEIPFRVTKSSHLVVRAKINNKGPFNFIVDTGAPVCFFTLEAGKTIGLTADENGWCILDKFTLEGGLISEKHRVKLETPFQLVGMNGMALGGTELHGLIGYDLLARHKIEIDVSNETMVWTPLDFTPKFPLGVSGKSTPGSLDALGAFMKTIGTFTGKKQDLPPELRGSLGIIIKSGIGELVVLETLKDSPGNIAGILPGDLILKLNDVQTNSLEQLLQVYRSIPAGKKVKIEILRKRQILTLELSPGKGL